MMKLCLLLFVALVVTIVKGSVETPEFQKAVITGLKKLRSNKVLNPKAKTMSTMVWNAKLAQAASEYTCSQTGMVGPAYTTFEAKIKVAKETSPRPSLDKVMKALGKKGGWTYKNICALYGPSECWNYDILVFARMKKIGCSYDLCYSSPTIYSNGGSWYDFTCFIQPSWDSWDSGKNPKPYKQKTKRDVYEFEEATPVVYENGCVANSTCDDSFTTCGVVFDGCADINCGSCGSGETCESGSCIPSECANGACNQKCAPTNANPCGDRVCGSASDGCNIVSCGNCTGSDMCSFGQCVPNPATCSNCPFASKCVAGACVCRTGFNLVDGECQPVPAIDMSQDPADIASWSNNANGNWIALGGTGADRTDSDDGSDDVDVTEFEGLAHKGTSQDVILWTESQKMPSSAGKVSYAATFATLDSTATFGLVFKAQDKDNFYYVTVDASNNVNFCKRVNGKDLPCSSLGKATFDRADMDLLVTGVEIRVFATENTFLVKVGGVQIPAGKTVTDKKPFAKNGFSGYLGLIASGTVQAWYTQIAPVKTFNLKLSSCVSASGFVNGLATTAGIPTSRVHVQAIKCPVTTNKREAAVFEVTYDLVGSGEFTPEALQSVVNANAELGVETLAESQIAATSTAIEVSSEIVAAEAVEIIGAEVAAEVAAEAGVSAGAAAGIAVGATAAVAAAGAAGAVVYKKKRTQRKSVAEPEKAVEAKATAKPKGAGRNVFDLDPNNKQSITGRSPAAV